TVPEPEIAHIESLLTVTGGRIVYAAGEYEGLAHPGGHRCAVRRWAARRPCPAGSRVAQPMSMP
ncbi:hypothetical protein, partial [Streptomyces sp. NPDC001076]